MSPTTPTRGKRICTKDPEYLALRPRLDDPGGEFTLWEAAMVIGVEPETIRTYASLKKIEFTRTGRRYVFHTNGIRLYLGWPLLPRLEKK